MLSKLLGVDDDVLGSNSILKILSDNELLLPSPLLQDLPTDTEVNQPVPTDTTLKPTPLSTKFSPPNPPSSVSPLPSTSSSPPPPLPPTANPSPTFSQTSSSIISAHKCPESEDLSRHSIAVTSEPNNQSEQQSTQPLKNKKKIIKNKRKSSTAPVPHVDTHVANQGSIFAAFDKIKRKLSPEKEADTLRNKNKISRSESSLTT